MSDGPGRPNRVPREAILETLLNLDHPCVVAKEVADPLEIGETGVCKRLRKLEEQGLVDSRKLGQARAWWITEGGRAHIANTENADGSD